MIENLEGDQEITNNIANKLNEVETVERILTEIKKVKRYFNEVFN